MIDEKRKQGRTIFDSLLTILVGLPWAQVVERGWKLLKQVVGQRSPGMYEVLEYECTLVLKDRGGKKATFRKRERVRYLQDNVIAYQDQAWGDGQILVDYRCSPGVAVDRYRSGHKTHVLISRRQIRNKGDIDEFNIKWGIRSGFLKQAGHWGTHISHKTKSLRINVIFPKSRPPKRTRLFEAMLRRSRDLGNGASTHLPDGRWQLTWETTKPRLHENSILQWEWWQ